MSIIIKSVLAINWSGLEFLWRALQNIIWALEAFWYLDLNSTCPRDQRFSKISKDSEVNIPLDHKDAIKDSNLIKQVKQELTNDIKN